MKPDVVYLVREGENNEMLRHSLRSLRHLPHRKVWIAGYKPSWVSAAVGHLPTVQDGGPFENQVKGLQAAIADKRVSDPFVLFNDDFFLLEDMEDVPLVHRGEYVKFWHRFTSKEKNQYRAWWEALRHSVQALEAHQRREVRVYEAHTPILVHKAQASLALEIAPQKPFQWRTLYGNLLETAGEERRDVKIVDPRESLVGATKWVSVSADVWKRGTAGAELRGLFSEPSRYEVSADRKAA